MSPAEAGRAKDTYASKYGSKPSREKRNRHHDVAPMCGGVRASKGRLPCHLLILPRRTNRHRTVVNSWSSSWNRLNGFRGFGTVQSLNPEQIIDSILKSGGQATRDAIATKTIQQDGQTFRIRIYADADAPNPLKDCDEMGTTPEPEPPARQFRRGRHRRDDGGQRRAARSVSVPRDRTIPGTDPLSPTRPDFGGSCRFKARADRRGDLRGRRLQSVWRIDAHR
jgi:hypothetical protein